MFKIIKQKQTYKNFKVHKLKLDLRKYYLIKEIQFKFSINLIEI